MVAYCTYDAVARKKHLMPNAFPNLDKIRDGFSYSLCETLAEYYHYSERVSNGWTISSISLCVSSTFPHNRRSLSRPIGVRCSPLSRRKNTFFHRFIRTFVLPLQG